MYLNPPKPQVVIPNYYQLDELPFVKIESLNLQVNLSAKRMLSVRNLTHKFQSIMSKTFAFWPKYQHKNNKQQHGMQKLALVVELPVLPLQNLTYIVKDLHHNQKLTQQQWNNTITLIQQFKQQAGHIVDSLMMIQNQIKMSNSKNIWHNVYYSVEEDCFRMKTSFKTLNFQISPFLKKNKIVFDVKQGYILRNQAIVTVLRQKLQEKINIYRNLKYEKNTLYKYHKKMEQFYERDIKKIDQSLLQLKLKYNYPLLRQKRYIPIQFIDGCDKQKLVQPIISNKNKHCMYGHFTGYNSSNFPRLQRSHCQFCGIQIKEMQQNKLLMFLRDNIFNPSNNSILYCPQFNRFKTHTKVSQVQITKRKIAQLEINPKQSKNSIDQQEQMQQDTSNQMKNQEENVQQIAQSEIGFINYMHLCLTVKNMYTLTKNRIKISYKKEIQYVSYMYNFPINLQNSRKIDSCFLPFQLTDPARGKFCNHLQFVDLRLFYKNSKKKSNYVFNQNIYICPVCRQEVKDSQLIYLKEVLVLIKFIRKLLQPQNQQDLQMNNSKEKIIDKNSIRIIINNVQKKVFIKYAVEKKSVTKQEWVQIQKFYSTLVDPYIPFSEHSLGLHKKSRRMQAIYNYQNEDNQSDSQRLQKKWFGIQDNNFTI